ncbi:MAG: MFS transporter, partial [Candidatus Eisenbacteria bacterium]
ALEIFERMSWYGWFTVMAVYVTGSRATGGLGFSTELRGTLQAIVPFFLYLLPVLTGALADRYGFKRMFVLSFIVMIASYYMLGRFSSLPGFVLAFLFVAVGAAMFKPVVVGTVARVTNDSNSATGFGIFYMMVNVGGFVGPIAAGLVRGAGWEWVFIASSGWAAINLVIVLLFYKEPETAVDKRSLRDVLDGLVEVLGNGRFFLTVGVALLGLVAASAFSSMGTSWFSWSRFGILFAVWIVVNLLYDAFLPAGSGRPDRKGPKPGFFMRRMRCGNWRFALFLLILSGFWTSFEQIFLTMPEYIRDFVETRPIVRAAERVFGGGEPGDPDGGIASRIATVNRAERAEITRILAELRETIGPGETAPGVSAAQREEALGGASRELLQSKVRVAPAELGRIAASGDDLEEATGRIVSLGRQVNPEFIINLDSLGIICFQVLVSFFVGRLRRFTTIILGMTVAAVGVGLSMFAGTEGMVGAGGLVWVVCAGILIFSFGEMMASPTSQEYVGRIAPPDKKALYMGYYFVAGALGNLFAGILSGQMYGKLARDMERPDLMWAAFGGLMLFTAFVFLLYNRFAVPKEADRRTSRV